jgi:hypothetical protein
MLKHLGNANIKAGCRITLSMASNAKANTTIPTEYTGAQRILYE